MKSKLKEKMKELGMTQAELAEKIGVSWPTMSRIANRGFCSKKLIDRCTAALGCNAEEIGLYVKNEYDDKLDAIGVISKTLEPFDAITARAILKAAVQLSGIGD
ncbi:MAG: helix-turn-helix protein [Lentisphaerae bacterium ADurb.Bin242]|nr:MAG: helix-turn-helix protein [Lentisphaerae bacterium ADurb.Bin242]